tara:strand:+ start:151 stop:480 length:330 start_codon:yes stop_codon:yes gene_type:complete
MLIKNIKILFLLVAISIFNSGCSSVKEAFDPQRKNGSEEFLVEKKAPLSMPPNFNELPVPQDEILKNTQDESDIESLLTGDDEGTSQKNIDDISENGIEKSILDKIKNN